MINFDERIIEIFSEKAKENFVKTINIGLGYTAVELNNGCCGVCCTLIDSKKSCTVYKVDEDFENKSCYELLLSIRKYKDPVSRAVVIAMINALTQLDENIVKCVDNNSLFDDLNLKEGKSVAMIGYFLPIVKEFEKKGVKVVAYDIGKEIGDEKDFYSFVEDEASALIITATSFINNTFSSIYEKIKDFSKSVAVLGPSTIMDENLYKDTPINILGGTYVDDIDGVLKAIRMGKGTPQIHKSAKKIYKKMQ